MAWTRLTLQVTTPLFNGGADPADEGGFRAADEAGLRVASIRGAMRFWFRALAGAFTGKDLALLAAMERRVFGGISARGGDEAAVPSPLVLRLPSPPRPAYDLEPEFLRGRSGKGIAYLLGLGLMEIKDKKLRLTRFCILPDPGQEQTFELLVRFQHDRRATDEVRHAVEALGYASLWLACMYGGFGARTRRGFGGVRIVSGSGDFSDPWNPRSIRTYGAEFHEKPQWVWPHAHIRHLVPHLRELAGAERKELAEPDHWTVPPPFPVLSQRFAPATLALHEAGTWEETLGFAGRQLRLFRANRPYDREDRRSGRVNTEEWDEVIQGDSIDFPLGVVGLPVVFHDKKKDYSITVNSVDAENDDQLRRASPLWLRPVSTGNKWRLLTFAFHGRFLPDSSAASVWLLPDSKAETAGRSKRELVVEQEDVTGLTSQWLEVMRTGGDFTTTIRD